MAVSRFKSRAGCFLYGKTPRTDFLPVGDPCKEEVLERGYPRRKRTKTVVGSSMRATLASASSQTRETKLLLRRPRSSIMILTLCERDVRLVLYNEWFVQAPHTCYMIHSIHVLKCVHSHQTRMACILKCMRMRMYPSACI